MQSASRKTALVAGAVVAVAAAAAATVWWRGRQGGAPSTLPGPTAHTDRQAPAGDAKRDVAAARTPGEPVLESTERDTAMRLLAVLKQRANLAFQEGRYEEAVRGYQDCISVTSALGSRDVEAVGAEQVIRSNAVMALIKLHQYEDARLVATMLLQDPDSPVTGDLRVKVLYRRGMASKALNEREAAISDFNAAIQLSPDHKNPAAEKELAALQRTA